MSGRGLWKSKFARRLTAILFAVCASLMICGCGSSGTKTIKFLPPEILLQDIQIPERKSIETVGDMAKLIIEDEKAMRLKNADMAALRQYRSALETEE